MKTGYVQIYTGDGKGKTTAALGLMLRAAGAGLRVCLMQFLKGRATAELQALRSRFPEVRVERFGRVGFVRGCPTAADRAAAQRGFKRLSRAVRGEGYDLVVADEITLAVSLGLLPLDGLLRLIREKPRSVELVLTGRTADRRLLRAADLVTEMRAVKHYFTRGVSARAGIEC
jgi:cob(I)alamin adenosyltransferase